MSRRSPPVVAAGRDRHLEDRAVDERPAAIAARGDEDSSLPIGRANGLLHL
jgi:hypothetical protein